MPGVARLGDISTGHDGYPPRPNDEASTDFFVNGKGVHRKGDHWMIHCKKDCHDGVLSGGSNTFFINGKSVGRMDDSISDGDIVATGSDDFIVG